MIPSGMRGLFAGLATAKIRRSALSPFALPCLYITVPLILCLAIIPEKLQLYVFLLAAAPVSLFSIAALILLLFDRDRLHTEEHLEKRQAMELVESKSDGLIIEAVDLVDIVNPDPSPKKLLENSKEDV